MKSVSEQTIQYQIDHWTKLRAMYERLRNWDEHDFADYKVKEYQKELDKVKQQKLWQEET